MDSPRLASLVWQLYWPLIAVVKENHDICARLVSSMLTKHIWADCAFLYHMAASFNFRLRKQDLVSLFPPQLTRNLGHTQKVPNSRTTPRSVKGHTLSLTENFLVRFGKGDPPKKKGDTGMTVLGGTRAISSVPCGQRKQTCPQHHLPFPYSDCQKRSPCPRFSLSFSSLLTRESGSRLPLHSQQPPRCETSCTPLH